jgi:hypothetical protein
VAQVGSGKAARIHKCRWFSPTKSKDAKQTRAFGKQPLPKRDLLALTSPAFRHSLYSAPQADPSGALSIHSFNFPCFKKCRFARLIFSN